MKQQRDRVERLGNSYLRCFILAAMRPREHLKLETSSRPEIALVDVNFGKTYIDCSNPPGNVNTKYISVLCVMVMRSLETGG